MRIFVLYYMCCIELFSCLMQEGSTLRAGMSAAQTIPCLPQHAGLKQKPQEWRKAKIKKGEKP